MEAEEFLILVVHNTNKKNIILNFPTIKMKNGGRCLSGGYNRTELLGAWREFFGRCDSQSVQPGDQNLSLSYMHSQRNCKNLINLPQIAACINQLLSALTPLL